jgi:protein-L-isoaspartate(D-aspartate) O-methyltransferase
MAVEPPFPTDAWADETHRVTGDPVAALTDGASLFPLSFMVPSWRVGTHRFGGVRGLWLASHDGASWARVRPYGDQWAVEQGGPRSLWDEVDAAREEWERLGRPRPDRFGLTVTADGRHRVRLDAPDGAAWELPAAT